jgi:hypothetical protein
MALVTLSFNVEYTDAPSPEQQLGGAETMACPYCGSLLPKGAVRCNRCDWTRRATETAEPKASDAMAVLLSIVPGLGHIYKGHKLVGVVLLLVVTPLALAFSFLAAFASAGFGLGIAVFYWIGVMIHVWGIEDRVPPAAVDQGEQY